MRRFCMLAIAMLLGALGEPRAAAQPRPTDAEQPALSNADLPTLDLFSKHPDAAKLYRLVKLFDFDERKHGNFGDEPMYWSQLAGPGLPTTYARGRFDPLVGKNAPPAFRLDIQTGNVGYEYQQLDLTVTPISDYFLVGFVRTADLQFASAIVSAYFVDRFGERIPDSTRIAPPVRWDHSTEQPWQRVELSIPGRFANAYALRIQFWVLQDIAWKKPDLQAVDPIERRDVFGHAWFDDFAVYRLPRVQIGFSDPAGLVRADAREAFLLRVGNAAPYALGAELTIHNWRGEEVHREPIEVPTTAHLPADYLFDAELQSRGPLQAGDIPSTELRIPVPDLAPGNYHATLSLLGDRSAMLERKFHFAVLPRLDVHKLAQSDLGVDAGPWNGGEPEGLLALLSELACGAVKLGIPMGGPPGEAEKERHAAYFADLAALVRRLGENRIEATGVMLAPGAARNYADADAIASIVEHERGWEAYFNPVFAAVGPLLPVWQLGAEAIELRNGAHWSPQTIEALRALLHNFVTIPRLAIPRGVGSPDRYRDDLISVLVPESVPTRRMLHALDFLVDERAERYWITLAAPSRTHLSARQRAVDLIRRIALLKALRPGRIYIDAPFELSDRGGAPAWQPTDEFVMLRTLLHHLAGRRLVTSLSPRPDVFGLIFENFQSGCLVIWSWDDRTHDIALYLGADVTALDLWGRPIPLELRDGKTHLQIGPTPIIVRDLDIPLVLLQASFHIAPTYIQMHAADPQPIVRFRNPYPTKLIGELQVAAPTNWRIEPTEIAVELEPGAAFEQELRFVLPPQQIAQRYDLQVDLILRAPEATELHLEQPLTLGLKDIKVDVVCHWQGDMLIVSHSLHNLSDAPVSFDAFCEPPLRQRLMSAFLGVAPGETVIQTYAIPHARNLAGGLIFLGISETNGARTLNQIAEVPR